MAIFTLSHSKSRCLFLPTWSIALVKQIILDTIRDKIDESLASSCTGEYQTWCQRSDVIAATHRNAVALKGITLGCQTSEMYRLVGHSNVSVGAKK